MLRYIILGFLFVAINNNIVAQARIVINNNAIITMDNGVYLVVDNGNANAITTAGTGGNIVSEDESNKVKWHIGTNTGTYTVPFTSLAAVKIPLDMVVTTPGTGSGFVEFSTYAGVTWDNATYMPATVTNMTNDGVTNNSAEVIDRFWIMSTNGYTTRPGGTFNFSYRDAEHTAVGNTITESQLKAERYYSATNSWDFYAPSGTDDAVNNKVNGAVFTDANFYPVWTLIDQSAHPLPITLIQFDYECVERGTALFWSTASESEADYFTILESADGKTFYPVANIEAMGNSTEQIDYSFILPSGGALYYKLQLTNYDLSVNDCGVLFTDCAAPVQASFYVFNSAAHQVTAVAANLPDGDYQIQLIGLNGAICSQQNIAVSNNEINAVLTDPKLTSGVYIVKISNFADVQLVGKVYVRDF